MKQKFQEKGYRIVDFEEKADISIINTCTVTNMSDRKSRQLLRKIKDKNPKTIIVATGCYAQVAKQDLQKMPEIDIVIGNDEKNEIVKYVEQYIQEKEQILQVRDIGEQKDFIDMGQITYTEKTRAVIKIQDGCNQFCSYCIIPYARGRVRSRKSENIIKEIEEIAEKGIKEVVITGIHIASYGKDFGKTDGLIELLEKINKIQKIKRIRLGSLEPQIITNEFVERLSKLEKICHHFHLSLQSGCNETLKRMNRKYKVEDFRQSVQILRKTFDDVLLTTDIIVGFPGETEEEFNKTYEYLKEIKFYKIHVFPYSPRKGTRAAIMLNQIDGNIKGKRSKQVIELSNENQKSYNEKYIGKIVEVLFEESENGYYKGHTGNYILVKCKTQEKIDNKIQKVEITIADIEYVKGILQM